MSNVIYSWHTTKTETGFAYTIHKLTNRETPDSRGHYCDTTLVHSGSASSRAIATRQAKKWKMYFTRKAA